jgi:hypothetical protein
VVICNIRWPAGLKLSVFGHQVSCSSSRVWSRRRLLDVTSDSSWREMQHCVSGSVRLRLKLSFSCSSASVKEPMNFSDVRRPITVACHGRVRMLPHLAISSFPASETVITHLFLPSPSWILQALTMSVPSCCVTGFEWDGEPTGKSISFPTSSNQAYVTGSSQTSAILFICDLFGWEFRNNRLLADHLARSVGATVYVPDL